MPLRKIQNPVPYFEEAADAASQYLAAKREHFIISAEIRAKREGKRAAYGVAAMIVASFGILLSLFWVTIQIHEAGVPAWAIAILSLLVLGGTAGILSLIAKRSGQQVESKNETSPTLLNDPAAQPVHPAKRRAS